MDLPLPFPEPVHFEEWPHGSIPGNLPSELLPEILQFVQQNDGSSLRQPSPYGTHLDGLHGGHQEFDSYLGAAPLIPLRGRDLEALMELFDRSEIQEILDNIDHNLAQLITIEIWDDDIS